MNLQLELEDNDGVIDRHPEKRRKEAQMKYIELRMPEIKAENPKLRLSQIKHIIFKEVRQLLLTVNYIVSEEPFQSNESTD